MSETRYAGVGDAAVKTATGKGWAEWFMLLDAMEASTWEHPQIARYLSQEQQVPDWWCQMVTVGYEQARGLRAKHQKTDGFTANGSRTAQVHISVLYAAWADDAQRQLWLPDAPFTVRKATPGKSLRLAWTDGDSRLDVDFYAKGEGKSQVALQHSKLPDAESATAMKKFWSAALDRLRSSLEKK